MADDIFNTESEPKKNALDSFIETNSAKPAALVKSKSGSAFMDGLNDKTDFTEYTPKVKNDPTFAGPRDVSFGTSDMDKYTAQEGFDGKLFNPDDPANNMRFAERETWGSAMGKALDDFSYKFGNTHNEGWKMYGRFADAALNGDMGKLALSETEMIHNFYGDEENAAKNHVFMDPQYDDNIFSKRSMAEFIGNSGFALGTFAQFAEELVIDAALTAITAPVGGEGVASFGISFGKLGATIAAKAAAKKAAKEGVEEGAEQIAKKSGFFTDVLKGANMSNTMSADDILKATAGKMNQAADVAGAARKASPFREVASEYFRIISLNAKGIASSKTIGDLAINVAKGVPLLGTAIRQGEKIAAGAKAGLSTGVLTGMGLMGARRVAQELSMSLTEANFETVGSYGDTLDLMVNKYKEDHDNEPPSAEEFEKMRTQSLKAASANLKTNTALLLITNKIQFGNLFTKFLPSSRVVSEILEQEGQKILSVAGKNAAGNKMSKEYLKGFMGTYGLAGKIAQDFGKKQAGYEFGKQFLKDFARFEVSEGIQENLQETSNTAWRDYYAGQYNTTKYTVSQAFDKGLGEQFTKQGFKTFLQGALTGSMIRIPTKVATHIIEKGQNAITNNQYGKDSEDNPINIVKKQINDGINLRNEMYQQMAEKKFTHKVVNFNAQVTSALGQTEAAAKNSKYEWVNHNDNGVLAGAVSANQAGTIKAYAQAIRNMGQTTSTEEFEAMTGTSLSETKYTSPQEWADDMARDVESYSKTVDSIRSTFKGMVDPAMYAKGSKDRIIANQHRAAQEEAVKLIALNSIKANNASERAQKVSQKFAQIKGITNSSEYGLRVLTSQGNLEAERGNIAAEVKILEESLKGTDLDANTRKATTEEIKNKKEELELIDKWNGFYSTRGAVLGTDDKTSVFIGKHIGKVDVKDADGKIIQAQQDTYDTKHNEVIDTFRKIINLKNKQGGNNTELSEADLRNGIEHVTDFINLDQDAKDYMDSVNSLMNPESYRTTITRMMDGNFKNILINVVDSVQDRVLDTVIDIFKITQNFDAALSMEEITKEINDALVNSEGYKKLLMLSVDPNLGIQNSEYAQEALRQFEQVLKTKLTEFVTKYNPDVFYNDIKEEDYLVFLADNNNIIFVYKESIAQKLVNGETLTSKQDAVYTAHKDEIDELKLNYTKVEAKILEEEEAEATTTTVFKNKDQQILEELQRQLDAELALPPSSQNAGKIDGINISIDDIETKLEGDLSHDEYNAFLQGDVSPELKQKLADKVKNQEPFKDRELDVATAHQQEIKDLNDPTKKPVVNEEADFDVPDEETDETDEDNEPGFSIAQMMGETTETEEEEELQPGAEEPKTNFTVEENEEEGGFDVKDENGKSVTKETITTEEEADELAKSMNKTIENVNFLNDLLEKRKDTTPITTIQKTVILSKLATSLKTHNTKNKTDFKNLEEYYNTPAGKEKINDLVEGVITGKSVAELKAERKLALKDKKKESEISTDNVTVTPTTEVVSAVEALHKRLQSVTGKTNETTSDTTTESLEDIEAELAAIDKQIAEEILNEEKEIEQSLKETQTDTKAGLQKIEYFNNTIESEFEDGDYFKVLALAEKQVKDGTIPQTPENVQLITNYPKLFEEFIKATDARNKTIEAFDKEAVLAGKPNELPIYTIESTINPVTKRLEIKWVESRKEAITNIQLTKINNYAAEELINYKNKLQEELARELYKELKSGTGRTITQLSKEEQIIWDKYGTQELRKSVDAELDALEGTVSDKKADEEKTTPVAKPKRKYTKKAKTEATTAVQAVIEFPAEQTETIPDVVITDAIEEAVQEIKEAVAVEPIVVSEEVTITTPEEVIPVIEEIVKEEVVPAIIEEAIEKEELAEVAEENDIAPEAAEEFVAEEVANVIAGKTGIDSYKPKTKSLLKRILAYLLSAGLIISIYLSSVTGTGIKPSDSSKEKIANLKEIVFEKSDLEVTKLEGCTEYVLNQVRSVIGKDGQEKLNMHGDAWTLGTITEKTGHSEYLYRALPTKKAKLNNAQEITDYLKKTINAVPDSSKLDPKILKPGDIVNLFYEGSTHAKEAYDLGGNVFTTHVGIIKLDDNGNMILEHNTGGTIHKDNLQDAIDGKLRSVKGVMLISGVFRMKLDLIGKTPALTNKIQTVKVAQSKKQDLLNKKKKLTAKLEIIKQKKTQEKSEKNAKFVERDNLMASIENSLDDITSCL